jgi:hypothetical protein
MVEQSVTGEPEQLAFDFYPGMPVVVQPAQGQLSSDGGLLPLRQFDQRWRYTERMARCLEEPGVERTHSLSSMLRQRVFGILAGYEDCNDHDTLRDDPVFKLIADRLPDGKPLASQPTLSRFENQATPAQLQKLIDFLIDTGIEHLKRKHGGQLPASIILDVDATDDPAHGHQQLTLFHGYYGQYQYFPLIISEPTTKHVFVAWLRPGVVPASLGADDDLMRVVNALRQARPDIAVHVRGDCGFGVPVMYQACEENGLTYTLGFATNPRLKKLTEPLMQRAVEYHQKTGRKARLFECFQYKCNTWPHPRTVVAKAECHDGGTNLRFVVTNLPTPPSPADWPSDPVARMIYDDYTQRGESEHRMDELKNGLSMDRLSCHRFMANFFRLLLHAAAFNLLNALRDHPALPDALRVGQPCTWRTCVVQLSAAWPWWPLYQSIGRNALAFTSGP